MKKLLSRSVSRQLTSLRMVTAHEKDEKGQRVTTPREESQQQPQQYCSSRMNSSSPRSPVTDDVSVSSAPHSPRNPIEGKFYLLKVFSQSLIKVSLMCARRLMASVDFSADPQFAQATSARLQWSDCNDNLKTCARKSCSSSH